MDLPCFFMKETLIHVVVVGRLWSSTSDLVLSQMYVNALIKKAGIFAGGLKLDKCKTCFEKAVAIMPDSTDIFVHRARVSGEAVVCGGVYM